MIDISMDICNGCVAAGCMNRISDCIWIRRYDAIVSILNIEFNFSWYPNNGCSICLHLPPLGLHCRVEVSLYFIFFLLTELNSVSTRDTRDWGVYLRTKLTLENVNKYKCKYTMIPCMPSRQSSITSRRTIVRYVIPYSTHTPWITPLVSTAEFWTANEY